LKLSHIAQLDEMAAKKICADCNLPISGNHFWYKGKRKCKSASAINANAEKAASGEKSDNVTSKSSPPASSSKNNWLISNGFIDKDSEWELGADSSINVMGNVIIDDFDSAEFPQKIGVVTGVFMSNTPYLSSFKNFPSEVSDDFYLVGSKISTFEGLSIKVGGDIILDSNTMMSSLHNIHKHILQMNGDLAIEGDAIKSHILGIMLVKGLKSVKSTSDHFKIINKHLAGSKDLMECQEELINAGFGQYAKL